MGQRHKTGDAHESAAEREMRNQEVLRANKELAAYFKGRRSDREARAALKIIKAFVRDRERGGAKDRPPLPGVEAARTPKTPSQSATGERPKRRRRREAPDEPSVGSNESGGKG